MIGRRLLPLPAVVATWLAVVTCAPHARARDVELAVLPPGCADPWQRVLVLAGALSGPIAQRGGDVTVVASAPDAVAAVDVVAFPDVASDGSGASVASLNSSFVADGEVEILETPFERIVVVQPLAGVDLLGELADVAAHSAGRFPDVVRRRVPRLRGAGVVALQVGPADAAARLPGSTHREVAARFDVRLGNDHGVVVAISRSLGGPARVHRAIAEHPPALLLHGGGARDDTCTSMLEALGVVAAVPRAIDLTRAEATSLPTSTSTSTSMRADAPVQGPWLAANVRRIDGHPAWPGHRIFDVDGVRIAVVGLVGTGEWARASADARAHLRVGSGRDAVAEVIAALRKDPAGPPDLVVALSSGDGAERAQLSAVDGLDVVVADFARDDGLPVSIDLVPRQPRENARHDALLAPVLHRAGIGRITASFDDATPPAGGPRTLARVHVEVDPLLDDGRATEASAAFAAPARHHEDELALRGADVMLPAVASVAMAPAAAPLVWGERIALLGEERRRAPREAALWTDDLWLRVASNAAALQAAVDVAVVRNMRRSPLVAGPLSRAIVTAWLVDVDGAVVVDVPGVELVRFAERLAAAPPPIDDASGVLVASGLDAARRLVGGRAIDPLATYRVLIDERVLADPRATGLVDPTRVVERRGLDTLVIDGLGAQRGVDALVADRATVRVPQWRLGIPALELRGSLVRTSPGLSGLAESLETRAKQRDLVAASMKALAFITYDAPGFTWDNQLRIQYDATFFGDATAGPPVVEPFDDVVATTELRRDLVRLDANTEAPVLAAFAHVAADGEVTPAPALRRQAQVREAAGLVWSTTGVIRELRIGGVAQQDTAGLFVGDDRIYNDVGLLALVQVATRLGGAFVLESTTDARGFIPDTDDRPFDLALRAQSVTRVAAPLSASTNGFVFVDVVALTSKPAPFAVEWNAVAGFGISFGGVLRR